MILRMIVASYDEQKNAYIFSPAIAANSRAICANAREGSLGKRNAHQESMPSLGRLHLSVLAAEEILVYVFIAELPVGIVPADQLNKLRHPYVNTLQVGGRCREQLSPVWPRPKRR